MMTDRDLMIIAYIHLVKASNDELTERSKFQAERRGVPFELVSALTDFNSDRTRLAAAKVIDGYLSSRVPVTWYPGIRMPALARFVDHAVRERAKHRCEDCSAISFTDPLVLHHIHYRSVGREVPSDLALLCDRCHHRRHFGEGTWWHLDPAGIV